MNPMLSHPLYRRALSGETIPCPSRRAFCVHLGQLIERVGSCGANDFRRCDFFGTVVSHNGKCQSCPSPPYEPDG